MTSKDTEMRQINCFDSTANARWSNGLKKLKGCFLIQRGRKMSDIRASIRKYWWAIGLFISAAYVVFESLVQHGQLSINIFKNLGPK